MNKVYLIGNLTRDPEMRATQGGISVCNFSIAVNRRHKGADGKQETDYFNIVAWRQLADLCGRYLAKGRKVAVVGSVQTRTYEAQDGSKRSAFDIVADEVEFLSAADTGGAKKEMEYRAQERRAIAQEPEYMPEDKGFTAVEDEELPF